MLWLFKQLVVFRWRPGPFDWHRNPFFKRIWKNIRGCFTTNHQNPAATADSLLVLGTKVHVLRPRAQATLAPLLIWISCWNAPLEGKTVLDFTVLTNDATEFQHTSFIVSLIQSAGGGLCFLEDETVDLWPYSWLMSSSSHWSSHICSKYERRLN